MSEPAPPADDGLDSIDARLRHIEALLAIGFSGQIQAKRAASEIGDEVSAEILSRTPSWTPAGDLKRTIKQATDQSDMTVKRRFNKLVDLGALERRGKATSTEYRNTGRFG